MVRGITRQVVVVKPPETKLFEQAIFLLREDALEKHGVTERELLEEARRVADGYVVREPPRKNRRSLPPLLWAAIGAAPVTMAWLFTMII